MAIEGLQYRLPSSPHSFNQKTTSTNNCRYRDPYLWQRPYDLLHHANALLLFADLGWNQLYFWGLCGIFKCSLHIARRF